MILIGALIAWCAGAQAGAADAATPALQPIQMVFTAAPGPDANTNLVAITMHPPPTRAWIPHEAAARDRLAERAGWRRSDVPPLGSMSDIAPPPTPPASASGWLAEDGQDDAEKSAIGQREPMRRGWLSDSVSRLQAQTAIATALDANLWDDAFTDEEELDDDFRLDQGVGTDRRLWATGWQEGDGNAAYWEEEPDQPSRLDSWRDRVEPDSRSGQGNVTRPAYGVSDDKW